MVDLANDPNAKLLGAGRSGKVFLIRNQTGLLARKIFYADKVAYLIHYFFFGSPNPYIWNEDAINCAFYRRRILSYLVQFWFDQDLRVAEAISTSWNQKFKAYQMDTEFIQGRHVALRQPLNQERIGELSTLVHHIMIPLQNKLIQAGFDGLVWQAGKGTPTALNNFLLTSNISDQYSFVWIDLESGVPALFPLNFLALISFYLPKSIKHGRALFDDVDTQKLKQYVNNFQVNLKQTIGTQQFNELVEYIDQLELHQKKWKSMKRVDRSIQYQLKKELITKQQASWYSNHPLLWYRREFFRILGEVFNNVLIKLPIRIFNKLIQIRYKLFVSRFRKFLFSQRYRLTIAKNYVAKRINIWQDRKQLKNEEADDFLKHLNRETSSEYLNDFGVHLGIKILIKITEYLVIPLLYLIGLIDELFFITWLILGGPIYRTVYTSWRVIQSFINRKEIPWIAFLVGLIPTIGILAYPCQLIYSAQGKKKKIAQFIVYDFFSVIGEKIPGWGGTDTQTEHFFNHLADKIARHKNRTKSL
ncbi:hypothetical protein Sta7437_1095 [Stanieria cyanosphaera PCC 7437]|uniref:Uncharacterized protein n=1 Tax=Stanieria cyanosphaera (strain ATCC 29371 / PCC 7437) TaxID=111780 RepID=K9XPX0_STAC7|nr:hypothetical protein [Stanieria cyanosphaera]AFZ34670.1 hypothetical protein Sta7437_1095 [Stanieria cyanosphaera PCC 7437]